LNLQLWYDIEVIWKENAAILSKPQ